MAPVGAFADLVGLRLHRYPSLRQSAAPSRPFHPWAVVSLTPEPAASSATQAPLAWMRARSLGVVTALAYAFKS